MGRADSELTAFDETVVFLDYFKDLPDPRQAGKVIYPLPEVLLLCLLAVLAGAETFVDIARFGRSCVISGRKLTEKENYRLLRGLAAPHTALADVSAQGFDLPQHNLAAAALTREHEVCTICALWVVRLPPNAGDHSSAMVPDYRHDHCLRNIGSRDAVHRLRDRLAFVLKPTCGIRYRHTGGK